MSFQMLEIGNEIEHEFPMIMRCDRSTKLFRINRPAEMEKA